MKKQWHIFGTHVNWIWQDRTFTFFVTKRLRSESYIVVGISWKRKNALRSDHDDKNYKRAWWSGICGNYINSRGFYGIFPEGRAPDKDCLSDFWKDSIFTRIRSRKCSRISILTLHNFWNSVIRFSHQWFKDWVPFELQKLQYENYLDTARCQKSWTR